MEGVGGSGSGACPFHRRHTSTKRTLSTMTDNHRSTSPDTLFVQQDDHYTNNHTAQRRRPNGLALPSRPPIHFAGDGLDYRRPIMSAGGSAARVVNRHAANVIDLTEEDEQDRAGAASTHEPAPAAVTAGSSRAQRPPRFGRDIIIEPESEAEEEEPAARTTERTNSARLLHSHDPRNTRFQDFRHRYAQLRRAHQPSAEPPTMDDIEFVEARPRTENRSRTPVQRSITPFPGGMGHTIDLTGEDDDDVLHVDTRPRPGGLNNDRPVMTAGVGTRRGVAAVADLFQGANRLRDMVFGVGAHQHLHEEITHARHLNIGTNNNQRRNDGGPRAVLAAIQAPAMLQIQMNYENPAFAMGYAGANEPTAAPYEPPPKVGAGFTRSPGEDEVIVCPNCGDELAMGETEERQEVWVIKKCGHAYCGDCAKNHASKKGKGKAPSITAGVPNFNRCVVDGCKESATAKSFVHVFVGG